MKFWDDREVIPAAGTRVHAALIGSPDLPSVVCVHGQGLSHRYFLPVARVLRPYAHVAAVDLPGFGLTRGTRKVLDVRGLSLALADWLRASGRGGSVLLANSAGCQVVVDLAVHSPELLGPVVLNGPTVDERFRTWPRHILRTGLHWPLEAPGLHPLMVRDYLDCGARRFVRTVQAFLHDPMERKLRFVTTPAIVVRGALDPLTSRVWAERVADALPHGRLVEIPWAAHTLNWSRPRALANVVGTVLPARM